MVRGCCVTLDMTVAVKLTLHDNVIVVDCKIIYSSCGLRFLGFFFDFDGIAMHVVCLLTFGVLLGMVLIVSVAEALAPPVVHA